VHLDPDLAGLIGGHESHRRCAAVRRSVQDEMEDRETQKGLVALERCLGADVPVETSDAQ